MSGESYIDDAALQQHAKQRVLEEATLHLLKRFSILLKRYSEWYQNAVTTICARAARIFRHTKRMSAWANSRHAPAMNFALDMQPKGCIFDHGLGLQSIGRCKSQGIA
jgi:hypothetical protein